MKWSPGLTMFVPDTVTKYHSLKKEELGVVEIKMGFPGGTGGAKPITVQGAHVKTHSRDLRQMEHYIL